LCPICSKTHLRVSETLKIFSGVIPPDLRNKEERGVEGRGGRREGDEGRVGKRQSPQEHFSGHGTGHLKTIYRSHFLSTKHLE
jgi:hypothetical protein